jgi:hypothetical protein
LALASATRTWSVGPRLFARNAGHTADFQTIPVPARDF